MHFALSRHAIRPGDRIVEPKSPLRLVQHHSIYLGADAAGTDWIIENKIGFGVRLVTADEYFRSVIEITRIERFRGSEFERKLLVQRALSELGKPYSLIDYNCEGFANYVQHGQNYSRQANNGLGLGFAACLAVLLVLAGSK